MPKSHSVAILSLREKRKMEKARRVNRDESPIEEKIKMITEEMAAMKK